MNGTDTPMADAFHCAVLSTESPPSAVGTADTKPQPGSTVVPVDTDRVVGFYWNSHSTLHRDDTSTVCEILDIQILKFVWIGRV